MLDLLSKRLSDMGKEVVRKTQNMAESANINSQLNGCNDKLNECFRQLGKSFYERNAQNPLPEYRAIFKNIAELNRTVSELKSCIDELNGIHVCSNCGCSVTGDSMFCPKCGYSIENSFYTAKTAHKICSVCGAVLDADARFCTSCDNTAEK